MAYRNLKKEEIELLLSQNCSCENWNSIKVSDGFLPGNIINTRFSGNVKLGIFSGKIEICAGISDNCGIYHSNVSNCEIEDNVYISEVRNLSNYIIEKNVAISNTGSLVVTGESTFGNGTEIEVLNEGGGRVLSIFDRLSSQVAYLAVLYRHDSEFIEKLLLLISKYCESKRSDHGVVGTGARILDSLIIRNVNIGSCAVISGASLLEEGTIRSCPEAPANIGVGVIARKFIVLSGSSVEGGVILDKCFAGQGVKMGKQFSAENSVFFANSEAFHGEACSLLGGPYTVTHHKSTLLIAALVSFFNAGSGTNQSNHMYKLGPIHQGILERGSKTGSFSYLLWPCHIGPFSVVMGKHYANFDTSDFPFSYITEEKGRSELTPAMNLFTVGTRRDVDKWPARDGRKDPEKMDLIHFELFSPYLVGKIINGIRILDELSEKADKKQDFVIYRGISIRRLLLKTTRKYYEIALRIYTGQEIVKRLNNLSNSLTETDLKNALAGTGEEGKGKWVEICGLFSPASRIDELVDSVRTGKICSVDQLNLTLQSIHGEYHKYAWNWCSDLIARRTGHSPGDMPVDELIRLIDDWKINAVKLNNMILKDAEKEFDPGSKIGFGIDGDPAIRDNDFRFVRGDYDKNKFVTGIQNESREIEENADRLISILATIKSQSPEHKR